MSAFGTICFPDLNSFSLTRLEKMISTVFLLDAHYDKDSVGSELEASIGIVRQRHLTLYLMPPYL